MNFTSHAIKRRQHSIERDVDLHVVIECLKKDADTLRSKEANNHRDLQIILKLLSSRQHEQRAWIIPTESLRVMQQMFCMEMFNGGKWQRKHYFNFISGIVAQFLVW